MAKKIKKQKKKNKKYVSRAGGSASHASCWFCEHTVTPDYKDTEVLQSFLSPRGKIFGKSITGTCAKCQRQLSTAVKLSRQMALLR